MITVICYLRLPWRGLGGEAVPMPDSGSASCLDSLELEDSVSESGECLGNEDEQSDNHVKLEHLETAGDVCVQTSATPQS